MFEKITKWGRSGYFLKKFNQSFKFGIKFSGFFRFNEVPSMFERKVYCYKKIMQGKLYNRA